VSGKAASLFLIFIGELVYDFACGEASGHETAAAIESL
jgi:hypothetical protein